MHQKFHKSEVARKFDGESFGGSENPSFLKLYVDAVGQGTYICRLKKARACILEKAKKNLSRC
jgi:hypothetical protein